MSEAYKIEDHSSEIGRYQIAGADGTLVVAWLPDIGFARQVAEWLNMAHKEGRRSMVDDLVRSGEMLREGL